MPYGRVPAEADVLQQLESTEGMDALQGSTRRVWLRRKKNVSAYILDPSRCMPLTEPTL